MTSEDWAEYDAYLLKRLGDVVKRGDLSMGTRYTERFYEEFAPKLAAVTGQEITAQDVIDRVHRLREIYHDCKGLDFQRSKVQTSLNVYICGVIIKELSKKRKERSCDVIKLKIEDGVKIIKDLFKDEDKKEIEEKRFWHHDIREELLDRVMSIDAKTKKDKKAASFWFGRQANKPNR
ncbi:hypothetical protein Tco_0015972 [Tanacetum coccineum]